MRLYRRFQDPFHAGFAQHCANITGPLWRLRARRGEGKTLIAINLAISLAMEFHQTALLVDADLRQPRVRQHFGLDAGARIERLPRLGYAHRGTADATPASEGSLYFLAANRN